MKLRVTLALLLFLFSSCAGYRVRKEVNPFAQYQIDHIAVPMFVNRSAFPHLSGMMTTEVIHMLAEFPDLRISASENANADAVLVGIIRSPQTLLEAQEPVGTTFVSDELKDSVGDRPAFYLPTVNSLGVTLTLVLIKRPTREELELIDTPFLPFISRHPKVVFTEEIRLETTYSQTIQETLSLDSGGTVNAVRNKKIRDRALRGLSRSASNQFKEVVIGAF